MRARRRLQYLHCGTHACREAVEVLIPRSVNGELELGAVDQSFTTLKVVEYVQNRHSVKNEWQLREVYLRSLIQRL